RPPPSPPFPYTTLFRSSITGISSSFGRRQCQRRPSVLELAGHRLSHALASEGDRAETCAAHRVDGIRDRCGGGDCARLADAGGRDRKSTRLNSSHVKIS